VVTPNDEHPRGPGRGDCAECGTPLSGDQRYCVECGARREPLPAAVAGVIAPLLARDRGTRAGAAPKAEGAERSAASAAGVAATAAAAKGASAAAKSTGGLAFMPSPRAAAIAVMGMLAFGVVIGSATSQLAQSAGLTSIVLEMTEPAPVAAAPEEEEEEVDAEYEPEATETATTSATEEELPPEEESAAESPEENPVPFDPTEETEAELPEVKHVFVIMLGENGYVETFGTTAAAPYLSQTLPEQGELIPNYYAVTKGDLANQIALISGQGPTVETAASCPSYTDIVPGTESATLPGQIEGAGCVYPAATESLPSQLVAKNLKWKAYIEDIGNGAASGQPTTCRHPAIGTPDASPAPLPGDAYVTWRNPFVFFHSVIDGTECAEADVGLDRLTTDLTKKVNKQTPTLSYIVPSACHDGGEAPCEPGQLSGPAAAEEFLKAVIPEITSSAAYKENGLIAITSAQARQTGAAPDAGSCCISPVYPNLPVAPEAEAETGLVKATGGGGKVGLLLISPFVKPGSVNETVTYNHFSLLLTIEELLGLEKLGYAAEPALLPFDESVFNAGEEEESAVVKRAAWTRRSGWISRAGSAAR
jgi:hypothetical protein